jgi:hypothetical protein
VSCLVVHASEVPQCSAPCLVAGCGSEVRVPGRGAKRRGSASEQLGVVAYLVIRLGRHPSPVTRGAASWALRGPRARRSAFVGVNPRQAALAWSKDAVLVERLPA